MQAGKQGISSVGLRRIHMGQHTVVIPFDVTDIVIGQHIGNFAKQIIADIRIGHIQNQLATPQQLVQRSQNPFWMSAIQIGIWVNHLRFKPNPKAHPVFIHLGN